LRLKRKSPWLSKGDENSKKIHHFENHRKNINIVWKVSNIDDSMAIRLEDIAKVGVDKFEGIYKSKGKFIIV